MSELRDKVIKLAHDNPSLRGDLLPLVKQADELSWGDQVLEMLLKAGAVKFKKQGMLVSHLWIPDHGLAILLSDRTVTSGGYAGVEIGLNVYSILPFGFGGGVKRAYRDDLMGKQCIILQPRWGNAKDYFPVESEDMVNRVIGVVKGYDTVGEITRKQFEEIETVHHIKIPSDIKGKYIREAPKIAVRRWGAKKEDKIAIPLDGSKPFKPSAWS